MGDALTAYYPDVPSGVRAILWDVACRLKRMDAAYMIVGGWCPFLRYPGMHPGTKDVDILFKEGATPGFLKDIIKNFLDDGYYLSAKYNFQLLRVLNVGGRRMVFNVDFLHPNIADLTPELFVDHIVLDVSDNLEFEIVKKGVSILLPSSEAFFKKGFYSHVGIEDFSKSQKLSLPLLDEEGLLISKAESVLSKKRIRDAFDVYLIIKCYQGDYRKLKAFLREDPIRSRRSFEELAKALSSQGGEVFDDNVRKILEEMHQKLSDEMPHEIVFKKIQELIESGTVE